MRVVHVQTLTASDDAKMRAAVCWFHLDVRQPCGNRYRTQCAQLRLRV